MRFDSEIVGTTPVQVELIDGVQHSVSVTAEGYEPQSWAFTETDLNDSQRQSRAIDVPLRSLVPPGRLQISSAYPVTATVRLIRSEDGSEANGPARQLSGPEGAELMPGAYEVVVEAPDVFLYEVRQVRVVSAQSVIVNTPRVVRVNIRAVPANCRVSIGDRVVDSTPILQLPLALGTYQVHFEWPGLGKTLTRAVVVDADGQSIFARPPE